MMTALKELQVDDLFSWNAHAQPAIDRAEENANVEWRDVAALCVQRAASMYESFTSDEVIRLLDKESVETHNLMALGAIFQKAAAQGIIENTGTNRQTTIKTRHRKLTIWKSLISNK